MSFKSEYGNNCKKPTYVYFIQAGYTGPIKIGIAHNVDRRLDAMQTGNHMDLKLLAKIGPFGRLQAEAMERKLHKRFKRDRIRGEWFHRKISLKFFGEE